MVLGFEAALAEVMREAYALRTRRGTAASESVSLLNAVGRVLAEAVRADRDQPPFDRATRDGFAVRAEAFSAGTKLRVAGMVRAGEVWARPELMAGEAIEIMTGAPVPAGSNAVAMVEHCLVGDGTVTAADGRTLRAGENVVLRGSEARSGEEVVAAGSLLGAAEIAEAATCGMASLPVWAKPKVAIVATGDELVEVDEVPDARQIRNSNSYAIAAMVTFHCFVEPFLLVMCGENVAGPRFVQATLAEDVAGKAGLMRVLPARLTSELKAPAVRLVGWQGSGDLAANVRANCYAVLGPEREAFRAGDVVAVLLR